MWFKNLQYYPLFNSLERVTSDCKPRASRGGFGFKTHINADEDGLIKATDYSTDSRHDCNHFTNLLNGKESSAYADSAYKSQKHDE